MLGQDRGAGHRHSTCLCAGLGAAPPLTANGMPLRTGTAWRALASLCAAVLGAENGPGGCVEGNTYLVIQSHVVWCLGAFFQSTAGTSGEGGRIIAAQEGLGLS